MYEAQSSSLGNIRYAGTFMSKPILLVILCCFKLDEDICFLSPTALRLLNSDVSKPSVSLISLRRISYQ